MLSASPRNNFLELGRCLSLLMDSEPDLVRQIAADTELRLRKSFRLIEVARAFEPLAVSRTSLMALGWTKVAAIARHVTPDNVEDLLELARSTDAYGLERLMRRDEPLGNSRCVLMYFRPKRREEISGQPFSTTETPDRATIRRTRREGWSSND
jgi:hypothetical protein